MNNQQEDGSFVPEQDGSGQTGSAQQGGQPDAGQGAPNEGAPDRSAKPGTGAGAEGSRPDEIPSDATIEGGRDDLDINPYGQEPA
ncbi:hypothetical protein C7T94_09045 [Pedobacter yulinensis]|uniref:Uncharacterized protein n=1 Tax=Pedobacter yulinensis TaxID=2126353 RepID=A0A2T3HK71_9SPHI|nr:hypothetical protein [Pedobacter yulinensis]PST82781.1 hypothetical protein C7T94_09045 [Pedobacter yulinensis]